jgi:hypothetical protein
MCTLHSLPKYLSCVQYIKILKQNGFCEEYQKDSFQGFDKTKIIENWLISKDFNFMNFVRIQSISINWEQGVNQR